MELGIKNIGYDLCQLELTTILSIENALKAKLIEAGYTHDKEGKLTGSEEKVFAAVKANGIPNKELVDKLFKELNLKLDYREAKIFQLEVYPDSQYKPPAFGYCAECRFI